jgi:hypothetical protein
MEARSPPACGNPSASKSKAFGYPATKYSGKLLGALAGVSLGGPR